jgi:hypothetical protein
MDFDGSLEDAAVQTLLDDLVSYFVSLALWEISDF